MHTSFVGKVHRMPKKYDPQTRAKAIRLVRDHVGDYASEYDAIRATVSRLGMNPETLRTLRDVNDGVQRGAQVTRGVDLPRGVRESISDVGPGRPWLSPDVSVVTTTGDAIALGRLQQL
jgi:hypothetical protein